MDFSNRRYSKPKVLKKRKDLNKYKSRNVIKDKFGENPPLPLDQPVLGARVTSGAAAPALSRVNRNERLTVKRGLFQKSQKSKVVYRNEVNKSERVARLTEDLDALIPSDLNNDPLSPHLYEQNNNVFKPSSPAVEVTWETQPDSVNNLIPPIPNPASSNDSRPRRHSPASKPTSSNHTKHRRTVSLSSKPASSNHNRSRRASKSLSQMSLSLPLDQDSPDPYPRTRAYVNAQRERMAQLRANAFELSSESEEVENIEEEPTNSPGRHEPELIGKYIELMNFVEKRFIHVRKEVFKDAPCNDYFKKLRNELWESYRYCAQESQQEESSNLNLPSHDAGQNECETVSLDSEQSHEPLQDEFVFSPRLCKSPRRASTSGSLLLHRNENEPARRFLENESYDNTGERPRGYSLTHSHYNTESATRYHSNHTHSHYSPAWSGGTSLIHRPRVRSPDLTTFSNKRHRSNSYKSSTSAHEPGCDYGEPSGYLYSARGVTSRVLSPNSRLRDTYEPPGQFYRVSSTNGPNNVFNLDSEDDDESPTMNFYPRKLF